MTVIKIDSNWFPASGASENSARKTFAPKLSWFDFWNSRYFQVSMWIIYLAKAKRVLFEIKNILSQAEYQDQNQQGRSYWGSGPARGEEILKAQTAEETR